MVGRAIGVHIALCALFAIPLLAPVGTGQRPAVARPLLFDTPEADRVLARLQVFPKDNPWHADISSWPVHPRSAAIIASIGAERRIGYNRDMNFVLVPGDQPPVPVKLSGYPDESDPGPYPVPPNMPIEGWPFQLVAAGTPLSLDAIQRPGEGDRHAIVVQPASGKLFEFYQARRVGDHWEAAGEATFDLTSNRMRPEGWTSTDAAGLPIFPAIVRYEECERGVIDHALRFTVRRSRRAYVYPARHFASRLTDADLPRMGERLRLKRTVDTSGFPPHARAIAEALKKHGMFVADNGLDWLMSIAPDKRIEGLDSLRRLHGSDFEVVDTEARR